MNWPSPGPRTDARHRTNLERRFIQDAHPLAPAQVRVLAGQAEITIHAAAFEHNGSPGAEPVRQAMEAACFNAAQSTALQLVGPLNAVFRLTPCDGGPVRAIGRVQGHDTGMGVLCRAVLLDEQGRRVGEASMTFERLDVARVSDVTAIAHVGLA